MYLWETLILEVAPGQRPVLGMPVSLVGAIVCALPARGRLFQAKMGKSVDSWVSVLPFPFTCYGSWGKLLEHSDLSFLLCKLGKQTVGPPFPGLV